MASDIWSTYPEKQKEISYPFSGNSSIAGILSSAFLLPILFFRFGLSGFFHGIFLSFPEIASHSGRNLCNGNHRVRVQEIIKFEYLKPGNNSYLRQVILVILGRLY